MRQRTTRSEHEWLLQLARSTIEPAELEQLRHRGAHLDWSCLLDRAAAHGLMPLLAQHASLLEAEVPGLPARVGEVCRAFAAAHRLRALQYMEELRAITGDFEAAGVPILPYKGPALGVLAFGDAALRVYDDLDVLVPRDRLAAARRVLAARGYRVPASLTAVRESAQLHWGHHEKHEHAAGFLVEVHWRLAGGAHAYDLSFDELWQRRIELVVAGRRMAAMSREDTLLVLCVHGAIHGWCSVGWICDVAELIQRCPIDWDAVRERAARVRRTRVLRLGLRLAHELLGAPLPDDVTAWVREDGGARALLERLQPVLFQDPAERNGGSLGYQLGTREGLGDKLSLVAKGTLSVAELDWEWIALPRPLFPLYHLVRPVRLAVRFGRQALS